MSTLSQFGYDIELVSSGIVPKPRKLNTSDLFRASRLIKKVSFKEKLAKLLNDISGVKEKIQSVIDESENQDEDSEKNVENIIPAVDATSVGVDFVFNLIEIVTEENVEKELYEFLSPILHLNPEEVEIMELDMLAECLMMVSNVGGWKHFFTRYAKSK